MGEELGIKIVFGLFDKKNQRIKMKCGFFDNNGENKKGIRVMKKTTEKMMFVAVMIAVILTATGCPPFRPSSVGSPDGYVPEGATIWTPNGQYVATKTDSDVVIMEDGEEVFRYEGQGSFLKGMAFSPDSQRITFMHHYGAGSFLTEYQIGSDVLFAEGSIDGWHHSLYYSRDGTSIILSNLLIVPLTPIGG